MAQEKVSTGTHPSVAKFLQLHPPPPQIDIKKKNL